jgi:hypothetical protein
VAKITLTPEKFELVNFDAAEILRIASEVADKVGLGSDVVVRIEIDEATMMGRAVSRVEDDGSVLVQATGGGFESLRKAREFDEQRSRSILGHALLRARDRLDPAFGNPPPDDDLTVPQEAAWASYIEGRLDRLGIVKGRPQRRMYHFRVRHQFNDASDRVFKRLWEGDGLSWADVQAASAEAAGATVSA